MASSPPLSELPPEQAWPKAKEICFNLLAARSRSIDELRQALRRKGFDPDLTESLLAKLDQAGLVDDTSFAESWVRSRHAQNGLSRSALVAELRRLGVDTSVAEQAGEAVGVDDEENRARQLVRKRLSSLTNVSEQAAVRRLLGMLGRKGYPQGLAYMVVRDELKAAGSAATTLNEVTAD